MKKMLPAYWGGARNFSLWWMGVDAPQCIKKTMKIYVVKCKKKKEEKIIEIVGVALFLN